ncbi:MAG: hypothetical protein M0C28_31250 [Candidatus Moduliflexus flocculans]|nr:hypothetical protein [Candidatus Moduliflexus flocculans]
MGQIQPVGGIAEKVEGFYRICRKAGLTGTQGVMVPKQNIVNLTLSREVLEAIRTGDFSIYAVSTIDEGIAVLTDRLPGEMDARGHFPRAASTPWSPTSCCAWPETIKEYRE